MLESLESLHMMHALLLLCSCVLAAHFMHISLLSGSEEIRSRSQIQC